MKTFVKKYLTMLQIFLISIFLSNCTYFDNKENKTQLSDSEVYSKGIASLREGNFKQANSEFDEVFFN